MANIQKIDFALRSRHHYREFACDARYESNGKPKPVMVFVHGFKGFKDWGHFNLIADRFAAEGFVFVKLNLSHNGTPPDGSDLTDMEAFRQNNFTIELDDLDVLLDYLFSAKSEIPASEMDLNRLFLVGHSRGGGLVLLKAAEDNRVTAVATWAAVSDLNPVKSEEMAKQWKQEGVRHIENARTGLQMPMDYQIVEDFEANKSRYDLTIAVPKIKQPLLIIQGDKDEAVPVSAAETMHRYKPDAEMVIVKGAQHTFGGKHPYVSSELPEHTAEIISRTSAFFKRVASHA